MNLIKYVDQQAGNDTDTGGQSDPYLTIQRAVDDLPAAGSGGLEIQVRGNATNVATFDFNSSGNDPTSSNGILIRSWLNSPMPIIEMAANSAFQDSSDTDGVRLSRLHIIFSGTPTVNLFNTNASNTSYWVWDSCIVDASATIGTQSSVAIVTGRYANVVNCLIYSPTGGVLTYSGNVINNNFVVYGTYGIYLQTGCGASGNVVIAGPSNSSHIRAIYLYNQAAIATNNICYTAAPGQGAGIQGNAAGNKYNRIMANNYVEGFTTNYQPYPICPIALNNVSCGPTVAHYSDFDNVAIDNSNIELTSGQSILEKDGAGNYTGIDMTQWLPFWNQAAPSPTGSSEFARNCIDKFSGSSTGLYIPRIRDAGR